MSLLEQTVAATEVVISVPKVSDRERTQYPIPDWLQRLEKRSSTPRLRIRRIDKDHGPATKLIPSVIEARERASTATTGSGGWNIFEGSGLSGDGSSGGGGGGDASGGGGGGNGGGGGDKRRATNRGNLDGNVLLLVVDDDTLYPPRLVETFLAWHKRLPDAALAFSGWPVAKTLGYPHWTENYLVYGNELYAPHPVSVIRGNCGYLVQSRFFDEGLWDYSRCVCGGVRVSVSAS